MRTLCFTRAARLVLASTFAITARAATFDWSSITPSSDLSWTPCYDEFQCTRFIVPLQYSDPSIGEAQIAIIMSPSALSHNESTYAGPILYNPGGPGGSGVDALLENVSALRAIMGPEFDIVSFDPRGVGQTTPALSIFASPAESLLYHQTYPNNVNESISSFGRALAQTRILGLLAADRVKLVAESVSTPAVAMDMLSISRAFGYEKLNYYGISYGTVLGSTFAAMFPNNVGRFVLDGVINGHDWYAGNTTNFLSSTDDALTSLYEACVAAGPHMCPIFADNVDLIRARVNRLIDNIHVAPLSAIDDSNTASISWLIVDYTLVVSLLLEVLYEPYTSALLFAEAVLQLEKGNANSILELNGSPLADICPTNASTPTDDGGFDAKVAIMFGDSLTDGNRTFAEAQANYQAALDVSFFATGFYAANQAPYTGWSIKAKDQFNGSFITVTSNPILFVSNTFDPVTPLVGARNMSAGFTGSGLLQQNGTGHTSASGFNTCTALAIRNYLTNFTLPVPGTICQPQTPMFGLTGNTSVVNPARSREARDWDDGYRGLLTLDQAVERIQKFGLAKGSR